MARSGTTVKGSSNPLKLRNYLMNGDMQLAQRNTAFTSPADGAYTLDRWRYGKVGAVTHTVTQDTDVPTFAQSNYNFKSSLRLNLTTPDTAIAAGDISVISQRIEGYNYADLSGKSFTLSFWVKATLPGTYCIGFRNSVFDRSFVAEYTINASATWEFKTVNVLAPPTSGTWNYTNGLGLEVCFVLMAGTNFQGTAGSWLSANAVATSNQVNGVNTGATDFRIAGAMLNIGDFAAPFRLFAENEIAELAHCMRYYEKSYNAGVNPGTATITGAFEYLSHNSNSEQRTVPIKVAKRVDASYATYSTQTGAGGTMYRVGVGDEAATIELAGQSQFSVFRAGGAIAGALFRLNWTADAEL